VRAKSATIIYSFKVNQFSNLGHVIGKMFRFKYPRFPG
jgi:hypothetical protein